MRLCRAVFGLVSHRIVKYGCIAQLVEQLPFKEMVGGSNPSAPTFARRSGLRWAKPTEDCEGVDSPAEENKLAKTGTMKRYAICLYSEMLR